MISNKNSINLLLKYIDDVKTEKVISIIGKTFYQNNIIHPNVHLGANDEKSQLKDEVRNIEESIDAHVIFNSAVSASHLIYKEIEKYKKSKRNYVICIFILLGIHFLCNIVFMLFQFQFWTVDVFHLLIFPVFILFILFFYADKHLSSYEKEFRRLLLLAEKIRLSNLNQLPKNTDWLLSDNIIIEQAIINNAPINNQINIKKQEGNITTLEKS